MLFGQKTRQPVPEPKTEFNPTASQVLGDKKLWYMRDYMKIIEGDKQTPRFALPTKHPVENFYKRLTLNDG